ncbi:MAG: methyltransferase domain-containing protein [Burkholderiaceae bacterium]
MDYQKSMRDCIFRFNQQLNPSSQYMKSALHVGCGSLTLQQAPSYFHGPDWHEIRYDIDPAVKPDVVGSMLDMSAIDSASVDAVYSSHNLEHVFPHEVDAVLGEFRRVLRPNGICVVTVPDLQAVSALIAQDQLEDIAYISGGGPITPLDIVYGHGPELTSGRHYMAHKTGFTGKTLASALLRNGFAVVSYWTAPAYFALWAFAYPQPVSQERMAQDKAMLSS